MTLSDHFFRRESARLVAALTRVFGVHNLAMVEDVVQEAFCSAIDTWGRQGVPDNPAAWLVTVAKNRALDVVRKQRTARVFAPELGRFLATEWTLEPVMEEVFGENAIRDDLLRMMFSCCSPKLAEPSQVALILRILCGFGVGEIADAFVCNRSAMEKRIARAKKELAAARTLFDVTSDQEFTKRLPAVERALYLLFNEGYHGASSLTPVRLELCTEAMRLTALLLDHPLGKTSRIYALGALMSLHCARLPARIDDSGNLTPWSEQNRSKWNLELVDEGLLLLEESSRGREVTEYHLEALIALAHASAESVDRTNWDAILYLYDLLLKKAPSPVVALNRGIALGRRYGPQRALDAIDSISDKHRLLSYPFYFATLGELEMQLGRPAAAHAHFATAATLARNSSERRFLESRVAACQVTPQPHCQMAMLWDISLTQFKREVERGMVLERLSKVPLSAAGPVPTATSNLCS